VPTSNGMRTHTGFLERTKWMVTDRGGRLALESVCCRKEISSLRTTESSFGSIALVGSYYQSTFSTFFDVLSHHLPKSCPGPTEITLNIFGSMQIARQENASIRVYSSQIAGCNRVRDLEEASSEISFFVALF